MRDFSDRPPVVTRPARQGPPHLRRYAAGIVAGLARKTKFVDPALGVDWPAIVGAEIAALCRPGKLSGGRFGRTLEVIAPNGAAAARVKFEAASIRRKVNDVLGPGVVGHISVRQSAAIAEADPRLEAVLSRFRASVRRRKDDK